MGKIVALTRLTVFDENFQMYDGMEEVIIALHNEGHTVVFISHTDESLKIANEIFKEVFDFKVLCHYRKVIKKLKGTDKVKDTIIVGSSNNDLFLATELKTLIINPGWSDIREAMPARYGITLDTPQKLLEAIRIIDNQNSWYFNLFIDECSKVISLTSANTYNSDITVQEKEVVEGFSKLLKKGDRKYFNSLYFHLISGIMKDEHLKSVDIWGVFPTSTGNVNEEIEELKERCRYLTGKKQKQPIFIRHTAVSKSHHTSYIERLNVGCAKHLDSIIINPHYTKKKLKGKKVCIIDDYLTNGISFETARNLLLAAGVEQVILLSLGRFKRGNNGFYQMENYEIKGDIYNVGYDYSKIDTENLIGEYDDAARDEIKNIYNIIYNT
ncbi:hypothetical protein MXM64_09840 [Kurthia gibsonii]|uniref:hypothetical protein n=1 Tax=Kurthia gibsonii TaxID=33946 RepID=UPI002DBBCBBF|nr:hypothetical protein [Kurthia gibsonii]MEB6113339.1 hypothetical protein [Kurthia gibsonii]